jgi:hypothetical protein
MRELVRRGSYVMTTHADEEADADEFSVFDVESAMLTGEIVGRQRDSDSSEWKYVVSGQALDDRRLAVVAKIGRSRRTLYIITVYAE